jgi:septal ring factor EnvC (AmiA/AmiB activator)
MRFYNGAVLAAALALTVGGCAKPRPCTIIPMQLELVRYDSEQIEKQVTAKVSEVASLQSNIDMARTRLSQLEQETADLEKVIEAAKADSSAAGRKK